MNEHAPSLADALASPSLDAAPVAVIRWADHGAIELSVTPNVPLRDVLLGFLEQDPTRREQLSGRTLRLSLGDRVPDLMEMRRLGITLRNEHNTTLIGIRCTADAARRFTEKQLHVIVSIDEDVLVGSVPAVSGPLAAAVPASAAESPIPDSPAVEARPEPVPVDLPVLPLIFTNDLPPVEQAVDVLDPLDDEVDPDEDWGDLEPAGAAACDAEPTDSLAAPQPMVDVDPEALETSPGLLAPSVGPADPTDDTDEAVASAEVQLPDELTTDDAGQLDVEDDATLDDRLTDVSPVEAPAATDDATVSEDDATVFEDDTTVSEDTEPDLDLEDRVPEPVGALPADSDAPTPVVPTDEPVWNPDGRGVVTALRRTLRSGNRVRAAGDLVVYGDVNSGAQVESTGNIIVLGALRGLAHAGVNGQEDAVVVALEIDRGQIRIGEHIAFEPDAPEPKRSSRGPLQLLLGRNTPSDVGSRGPILARVCDDTIGIEPWRGRMPEQVVR